MYNKLIFLKKELIDVFKTSGTLGKNELMEIIPAVVAKKVQKSYYQIILVITLLFAIAVVPLCLTSPITPSSTISKYDWIYWISLLCSCLIMIIPLVMCFPRRRYKLAVQSILSNYQDLYGNTCKNISASFEENSVKFIDQSSNGVFNIHYTSFVRFIESKNFYIIEMKSGSFVPTFKNQLTPQEQTDFKKFISTKVPVM